MLFLAVAISFFITVLLLPVIIRFFIAIDLLDIPEKRKVHVHGTPSMAGIAIFISLIITVLFTVPFQELVNNKYVLAGAFLTFLLGFRDDISSLQARHKLVIQALAAFLVVHFTGIRLDSLHGLVGIYEIPGWIGTGISVFFIMAMSNAFNLIDGIDGLAGIISASVLILLGTWFIYSQNIFFSILCMALASALIGFLLFNWHPARIFLGDTGSMFIGFLLSCITIVFINENSVAKTMGEFYFPSFLSIAAAILIIPIYDTMRVFIIRILAGRSPFFPDKLHIHHILVKQGYNHSQTALILFTFNMFSLLVAWVMQGIADQYVLLVLAALAFGFGTYFDFKLKKYLVNQRAKAKMERSSFYISKSA